MTTDPWVKSDLGVVDGAYNSPYKSVRSCGLHQMSITVNDRKLVDRLVVPPATSAGQRDALPRFVCEGNN
jgi:hypothetical protein